jgi:hypothetical protein
MVADTGVGGLVVLVLAVAAAECKSRTRKA